MTKIISKGLTFDDILLLPGYSEVTPDIVDVSSKLTHEITLKIPLISAAMDTVTGAGMAISMARAGGVGVIHKNMSIAEQAAMVQRPPGPVKEAHVPCFAGENPQARAHAPRPNRPDCRRPVMGAKDFAFMLLAKPHGA